MSATVADNILPVAHDVHTAGPDDEDVEVRLYRRPSPLLLYSRWTGEPNLPQEGIYWLPFNLALKYGPWGSIVMTRLPGQPLNEVLDSLDSHQTDNIRRELDAYLTILRKPRSPWGSRVCSSSGGVVLGARIPLGAIYPCDDERIFVRTFLYWRTHYRESYPDRAEDVIRKPERMLEMQHAIVFSHGDLLAHNILVHGGHSTGIIDWEFAGWFPAYWEYTQMLRVSFVELPWPKFVRSLPGYDYEEELRAGEALWEVAADSFTC